MRFKRVFALRERLSVTGLNLFARIANRMGSQTAPRKSQDQKIARVLVLELWNIGDVILAMPFLAQIRRLFPRARVTLLARAFAPDLLGGTGLVDEFIVAELGWSHGSGDRLPNRIRNIWRVSRELRRKKFDIVFSSRLHIREHVLLALAGARRRVGFSFGGDDAALTDRIDHQSQRHKVQDWMSLLAPFGGAGSIDTPQLRVTEQERAWARGYLSSRGALKDELVVGMHAGASLVEKRWPLQRFREVAEATSTQPKIRVLAFAEPSGYGAELFDIPKVIGAQVGLRELIALIQRCELLICNDSGPMHIAAALGVPTVAMFGPGIDQWFAPVGEGHEILRPDPQAERHEDTAVQSGIRSPRDIKSRQVLDAVGRVLERVRPGNRGQ